jgi:hypothetical protein
LGIRGGKLAFYQTLLGVALQLQKWTIRLLLENSGVANLKLL